MFARIFVSFSIATVLAMAVSGAFLLTHQPNLTAQVSRAIPVEALQSCALRVVHAAQRPEDKVNHCTAEYVIGTDNRDLFSRPVPVALVALAAHAKRSNQVELSALPGKTFAVIPVNEADTIPAVIIYNIPSPAGPPMGPVWWQLVPFAFVAAIICYLLTGYIVKPLQRLGLVADDLGVGDLSARTDPALTDRKDEFGDLARTFNRMASRIESLVSNQRMFLAHVSHELGSPLTRINMRLALARRKAAPDLIPDLDRIDKESEQLNHLVQQLLFLARLESGNEFDKQFERFFVSSFLHEIIDDANFEAQQTGRSVRFVRMQDFCVTGHRELLKRAVENVVRNALRFTPTGGTVDVEFFNASATDTGFINVMDQGPGVKPHVLQQIFEPFATSGASGGHSGVGLGLAIARQAVLAHQGEISASNLTNGLLVTIELPVTKARPTAL
ncbi:MAG: ATP-binding protein [Acidobacteriota bacterium]|nr:ATP-binding protein [Acidobacteriota bacterium]